MKNVMVDRNDFEMKLEKHGANKYWWNVKIACEKILKYKTLITIFYLLKILNYMNNLNEHHLDY